MQQEPHKNFSLVNRPQKLNTTKSGVWKEAWFLALPQATNSVKKRALLAPSAYHWHWPGAAPSCLAVARFLSVQD